MLKITRFITNNKNNFIFVPSEINTQKNGENHCGKVQRGKNIKWQETQIISNPLTGEILFQLS